MVLLSIWLTFLSISFIINYIINLFDDPDDQVHAFNCLFQFVLDHQTN